jgi:hypothetical protein
MKESILFVTEVGRDGVLVGFHRNWCYGSKSNLCCKSEYETTLMGWVLERVFWSKLPLWRIESYEGVSNKKPVYWLLRRCDDGDYLIQLWEVNCYKGRLRWSQVYMSKFHKWIFGQNLKRSNYVMYLEDQWTLINREWKSDSSSWWSWYCEVSWWVYALNVPILSNCEVED